MNAPKAPPSQIDPAELTFEYFRASGPGGQNVNKVSTAARLRFDLRGSESLPAEVKERLARLAGKKLTEGGVLILEARRYRTQEQNQQDAIARLNALVARAWNPPPRRRATRRTKAAGERRLAEKKRRGQVKSERRAARETD